ncbi:hypothetical protein C8A00DRAFT_11026 [Chaetomidium leptoderma]|uniref:Uncharacterized protein n=1 Tax=Chaetomidium leptoderma TaxID=669021 RepID=A0AAN7A1Q3_9PEZI|nr:hypothetical protein C8A00DRAFT_11026 [Chaetomidium leptoderma]
MGTRHLICVFWKGKWVVAQYGQFDGYPEGQGVKILKFLSVARNIENLKAGLENHIYEPTKEEIDAIWAECNAWDEARRAETDTWQWQPDMVGVKQLYPSLARETSAGILGIIARASQTEDGGSTEDGAEKKTAKKIPLHPELEFANDGLFCEWAYVIDLDNEALEVYGGSEYKHDGHRFKGVGDENQPVPGFVCSFKFSEIYLMKSDQEFLDKIIEVGDERAKRDGAGDGGDMQAEEGKDDVEKGDEDEDEDEDGGAGSAKGSP